MNIPAGNLRHRVSIQQKQISQNPVSGELTETWADVWTNVPAAVEPLSAREFIAAQSFQSEVSTRITIRYRAGITAAMRILHNGRIFNIQGVLADPDSGRSWLTLPCSEGVNNG